jgi:ATP-dependent helicase/nuclease subunit B
LGRDRYLRKIEEAIASEAARLTSRKEIDGEDEDADAEAEKKKRNTIARRMAGLEFLKELTSKLLELSPSAEDSPEDIIRKAGRFLKEAASSVNELDNYSLARLSAAVGGMERVAGGEDSAGIDAAEWLAALPAAARVMGSAPRPGHLHVDSVYAGGHSGRAHTFIIGMDDAMFPGGAPQDPLLLDGEKRRVSDALTCAADRLEHKTENFSRLLCGLRGSLTMGYSCRDLLDDSEVFPSSALMSAFRLTSGERGADLETVAASLGAPASFAPADESSCLDETEWWMWRLLAAEKVSNALEIVNARFPRAKRGALAAKARESSDFTEFDGFAPRAGADNNPFDVVSGSVMSSSRLELFGKCPLAYFFKYILKIAPPEEVVVEPYVWLDPLNTGNLLHKAFEDFYVALMAENRLARLEDESLLWSIIEERAAEYRELFPPPSEPVYEAAMENLKRTAKIFIIEESKLDGASAPRYLEASIGLPRERAGKATPLDSPEPVELRLLSGSIRARGRIDRVDALPARGANVFTLWDYKTGGTYKYRSKDPFNQGRVAQHALYIAIVEKALERALKGKSAVAGFGFFFPSPRAGGERLSWSAEELADGKRVIDAICSSVASGSFIATNNCDDCGSAKYQCEYAPICRDVSAVANAADAKLENQSNETLAFQRELRKS